MQTRYKYKGFTLLEILLVITLIGILAAIALVAINPNRQLAQARNLIRQSDINNLYNALETYTVRNRGDLFPNIDNMYKEVCDTGTKSVSDPLTSDNYCDGKIDLRDLVPTYLSSIPKDNQVTDTGGTGYEIAKNNKNQITIRAVKSELAETIAINFPEDILYAKAGGFPSLDLNFAGNKSLIDNISGNNLINFSRNSIGTYVGQDGLIKTAAVNEPRFDHNPVTGESLGLLVEEARTNLETNTESFVSGNWQKVGSTIQSNIIAAPDGTLTADKLVSDTSYGTHYVRRTYSNLPSSRYVISVYAKAAEHSHLAINANVGGYRWTSFDLINGIAEYKEGDVTTGIQDMGNGWYRCWWISAPSATALDYSFSTSPNGGGYGSYLFTGDNFSGIYLWGAQLEAGSFPTSYIPTTASSVTRQADNASITGTNFSNWYNALASTFFTNYTSTLPTNARILNFGIGATSTVISNEGVMGSGLYFSSIGNISGSASDGVKVASATLISESAGSFDGSSSISTGACSYCAGATSLNFIPDMGGSPIKQNWIKRVTYWPTRLSNTLLQNITQ